MNFRRLNRLNILMKSFATETTTLANKSSGSKVDSKEIDLFKTMVSRWWDPNGPVKPLHTMNKLRVPLIRDGLINTGLVNVDHINTTKPLQGLKLLDIGCGAGILSEPLSRLGASVTGLDANAPAIEEAKIHASKNGLEITYLSDYLVKHKETHRDYYDAVIASEVIEHVSEKQAFVEEMVECTKPGGSIIFTTLNRTLCCQFLCIYVAENILNILPKGTHEIDKFIKPHELQNLLEKNGCKVKLIHGMFYNYMSNRWYWSKDDSLSYALQAVKGV